jgi:glycosyltransferase involved in cell wall biosynthesis
MRILWITNSIFPAPSKVLEISHPVYGGWMFALAKQLNSKKNIKLGIATVYSGNEMKEMEIEGIVYYLLPSKSKNKYQKSLEIYWKRICKGFRPDLIHIHGTEHTHGLACMRVCPNINYVISIQGLIGISSRYYLAGIKKWEIFKNITFRDLIKVDSLFQASRKFRSGSTFETEYILRSRNIIGRTSWDYVHSKAINPNITYYFCNEILRDSFYTASKWHVNNKNNYTIFLSQASEPLKGLHQVIKALAFLKSDFPEIKLRIAGPNVLRNTSILEKIKRGGYGSYIHRLIDKFNLKQKVFFTGPLLEDEMISECKNAHLFICPSSIENSPNSLGEAQLLGVPTISAYVGGIPDMVTHGESGMLYRFEEVEMLAENIRTIFTNDEIAIHLSKNGIKAAEQRHNREINASQMVNIYTTICFT